MLINITRTFVGCLCDIYVVCWCKKPARHNYIYGLITVLYIRNKFEACKKNIHYIYGKVQTRSGAPNNTQINSVYTAKGSRFTINHARHGAKSHTLYTLAT